MKTNESRLNGAQGVPSIYTKHNFFKNNDSHGLTDATVFLDHYTAMSPNSKKKYVYLWELFRNNSNLLGMLTKRIDKNDVEYVWVEFELPRGKASFKMYMLSTQMFDFLVRYQRAEASVRFTVQELITEAERIEESTNRSGQQETL